MAYPTTVPKEAARRTNIQLALVLVIVGISSTQWHTMRLLVAAWAPEPDNIVGHGWIAVIVAMHGYIRESARKSASLWCGPDKRGIVLIVLLSLASIVAYGFRVEAASQLIWLSLLVSSIWLLGGLPFTLSLWRPTAILLTALPAIDLFHPFLWQATNVAVQVLLHGVGVPVYISDNVIELPYGTLEIAAGCAGMGFFSVGLTLAAITGYLGRASFLQFVWLSAGAAVVSMASNWIRIFIIVIEAHRTRMQTTLVTEGHYTFGWLIFAAALMIYVYATRGVRGPAGDSIGKVRLRQDVSLAPVGLAIAIASMSTVASFMIDPR